MSTLNNIRVPQHLHKLLSKPMKASSFKELQDNDEDHKRLQLITTKEKVKVRIHMNYLMRLMLRKSLKNCVDVLQQYT